MPESDQRSPEGPLVCTVLPTYNERDNIRLLIEGVLDNADTPTSYSWSMTIRPTARGRLSKRWRRNETSRATRSFIWCDAPTESGLTSAIQRGIDEAIRTHRRRHRYMDGLRPLHAAGRCAQVGLGHRQMQIARMTQLLM